MVRRSKKNENSKGAPLWMNTYADMITLVLTFFILLFSFSSLDIIKWQQVVASIRGSMGVMDGGRTLDPAEFTYDGQMETDFKEVLVAEDILEALQRLQEELEEMQQLQDRLTQISSLIDERIIVEADERGIVLRFQDRVLFDKGRADIGKDARQILIQVALILKDLENPIRIEGHTDNLPINTPQFPSNWELSTSRATNVLRVLLEQGLNPKQFSAVGYGEYHPLVPNADEVSRQQNRRVDIVILRNSISLQEPTGSRREAHGQ